MRDPTHLYEGEVTGRSASAARFVSIVTHAPIVSAFLFALLNLDSGDTVTYAVSTAIALVTATFVPIAVVQHFSKKTGNTDGDVYRKEDRALPLLGGVISYAVGAVLLHFVGAPDISTAMMASYAVSTVVVMAISRYWKISIHMTGIAGPAVALTMAFWPWGAVSFLLVPVVAWSRYVRRKHTPAQIVGGTVFAVVWTYCFLTVFM